MADDSLESEPVAERPRLIEVAFPLKQASLDSVHEKNVRHGHISTLHIWPARRPLAASRAALVATLLPDPGNAEERKRILERLSGRVVDVARTKKLPTGKEVQTVEEQTVGGILHWGRESGPDLAWFQQRIREAYGGRAPKVLDPFAGGGAIPLEAMRLGCETTAVDLNPVAWFILKCTLEYPHRLAGQKHPLPSFASGDRDFMERFLTEALGFKGALLRTQMEKLGHGQSQQPSLAGMDSKNAQLDADLAWHVRAWGQWVLQRARADLEKFYPVVDGKPTVAYLWARTVQCKNCRATVPLLKTRWLAKSRKKRVLLTLQPDAEGMGVTFGVQPDVPIVGDNTAQRREHDRRLGAGTMARGRAVCPCCQAMMTSDDIRLEGQAGRLGVVMTAVVVDGLKGKEYRLPTDDEVCLAAEAEKALPQVFSEVPFGVPEEPIPQGASRSSGGSPFTVYLYGLTRWRDLFTPRQLLALGTFVKHTRAARDAMVTESYSLEWIEAVGAYLALAVDRIADRGSSICHWDVGYEKIANTFSGFRLPINWDFSESSAIGNSTGSYSGQLEWIAEYVAHASAGISPLASSTVLVQTATHALPSVFDIVVTDPPYYDAIPYSDLMDFFYVWLRRTLHGLSTETDRAFHEPLGPKWDHEASDGELIDDASRFGGDRTKSKAAYEDGMARAFKACYEALKPAGRMVVVFANKQPDAWETLASAIIRTGFVVDGSWPIQTEMGNRTRALSSAALSSSVWLVCKKRPEMARPGWDNRVLAEMQERIITRLRDFWDAGIRGPDFVWAATGPALEIYSRYPAVKKANEPGQFMLVPEFLRHVRRMVVDFVVGRVLSKNGDADAVAGLDDVTTYYLLHRYDFGLDEAPVGACILYALSCGLSDHDLAGRYDLLVRAGGPAASSEDEGEPAEETDEDSGEAAEESSSSVRLKAWSQRKHPQMGYDPALDSPRARYKTLPLFPETEPAPASPREVPLIDQVHRLMQLWNAGDAVAVDDYIDIRGLRRHALFHQLLQALIELAPAASQERSLLESISNHIATRWGETERLL